MSEQIRVGVVGVGHIGREHARVYGQLPGATLAGVFDLDAEAAARSARQHRCRAFGSVEEMLAAVDAVTVATPTVAHFTTAMQMLAAGKHVLIEKPITESPETARQLVQEARQRGLILQVGHIERFNPVLRALEERLTAPKFIEAHRLSPYPGRSTDIGVVLDLMIHDLDVVLHLVRSPIVNIDAVGVPVLSRGEDIANARIRFENGCVANLTTSRISPEKMRKIRVFQADTYLSLDYMNQAGELYRKDGDRITREKVAIEKDEPLKLELRSFVDCVRLRRDPVVSGAQGARALDIALEITDRIARQNGSGPAA
jgi:predicted dehydrogenase